MKSQAITTVGAPLEEVELETPTPTGSEVLLETQHCGVCHSDLHIHEGFFDLGGGNKMPVRALKNLPFTLGHEIQGKVVAVGPDAQDVEIGKQYAAFPWIGCGECGLCKEGRENLCLRPRCLGTVIPGGYATHVVVPDKKYLVDIEGVDGALAACYMCSGITAYSAIRKLEDVMAELSMTEGFDVGLEMSGVPSAVNGMLNNMNHGGRIAMLGIPPSDMAVDWNQVIFKGLVIKGIYGREMFETWYKMASLIQSGLDISPIITHEFPIDEFQKGFDTMGSGQSGKVILNWD